MPTVLKVSHAHAGMGKIKVTDQSVWRDMATVVALHRDYWDTAEELYAKLPIIGALVRLLTRKLSATA